MAPTTTRRSDGPNRPAPSDGPGPSDDPDHPDRPDRPGRPDRRTLARRGLAAVVLAPLANALLLWAVLATDAVQRFDPLQYGPVTLFSALGALGAALVYAWLVRRRADPDRTFVRVAGLVLLLSFVPDVALLFADPAATVPAVVVLVVMHVVVAVISVGVLTGTWR